MVGARLALILHLEQIPTILHSWLAEAVRELGVVDVTRTMHILHHMNHTLQVHNNSRVREVAVILQILDADLQVWQEVAIVIVGTLVAQLQILVSRNHMPRKGVLPRHVVVVLWVLRVADRFSNLIHPRTMFNHRCTEILLDLSLNLGIEVFFDRIGDKTVSPSAPRISLLQRAYEDKRNN